MTTTERTSAHTIDLTPATDAFMVHAVDSLDRAEKHRASHTRFLTEENFIWTDEQGAANVLTVRVIAEAFMLKGCYLLRVVFSGKDVDKFRTAYQAVLIAETTRVLEENNWKLAQLRDDQGPEVSTSHDGIFFTLTRCAEKAYTTS